MPHMLQSLRGRLLALVVLSTLPFVLCAIIGIQILSTHEESRAVARALEVNRQIAIAIKVTLKHSFTVLAAKAQSPLIDSGDLQRYAELLDRTLPLMPEWHSMIVATPDGRPVIRTAGPRAITSSTLVEPASFARVLSTLAPTVGQLGKGPSGAWAIPLRVPVIRNGTVRYVLTAPLRPVSIADLLALFELPKGWTVSVFDTNGRRIARSPSIGLPIGGPISTKLFELASEGTEGSGITYTSDGNEVYTAYLRLPELGWTVATGIPTAQVKAAVSRAIALYGAGVGLSLLLAGIGALVAAKRISAPIRDLRLAALAIGRGEVPTIPSAHISEIQDVNLALSQSAKALMESEQARCVALNRLASANEGLREADRRKDEFISTLSHELRNPLAPMAQAATVLSTTSTTFKQRALGLAVIERQVAHMGRLLDALFDASQIGADNVSVNRVPVNLTSVLLDALSLSEVQAAEKCIKTSMGQVEQPVYVDADELLLQQLFAHLLSNAVKFTPVGGRIHLEIRCSGSQIEVEVTDDGIGIAADQISEIFRPFGRVARPGADGGGLGVGLALAKKLAELHQGELRAHSHGVGRGSTFTVSLPRSAVQVPYTHEPTVTDTTVAQTRCVLVADDNVDIAQTLQAVLELEGHKVRLAFDGQQAVDLCRAQIPEVVVLDIGMPKLDGLQAARAIRDLPGGNGVFLVALSGWGQANDVKNAKEAGFDRHITKPANLDELLRLVASAER